MKLTPGGIYPCPICGKPRGSKQHSGEHDECSRIQQKRTAKTPRRKADAHPYQHDIPPFAKD